MKALLAALVLAGSIPATAAERPIIRSRSDLPPTRFVFAAPPSQELSRPAFFAMLPAIRREAERLMRDFDI